MKVKISGIAAEMKRIRKEAIEKQTMRANAVMGEAMLAAVRSYIGDTPVWSGAAVRNYQAGIDRVPLGVKPPVGGEVQWPLTGAAPEDTKNEQRRAANAQAALFDAGRVLGTLKTRKKLAKSVHVVNNDPVAPLIEAGTAPEPGKARYPGGLTARALQRARAAGKGFIK